MAEEIEVEEGVVEEVAEIIGDGMVRVFLYDDKTWDDPGDEFSDDDVLNQIAGFMPELAGGKITREVTGDYVTVTFTKAPKRLG